MRADIEHVMAAVGSGATPDDYRRAILDENAARKGTGTSRMWALKRLKLRYALDRPETIEFAVFRRVMRALDPAGRGLSARCGHQERSRARLDDSAATGPTDTVSLPGRDGGRS
jgi:hypothetical protein